MIVLETCFEGLEHAQKTTLFVWLLLHAEDSAMQWRLADEDAAEFLRIYQEVTGRIYVQAS